MLEWFTEVMSAVGLGDQLFGSSPRTPVQRPTLDPKGGQPGQMAPMAAALTPPSVGNLLALQQRSGGVR